MEENQNDIETPKKKSRLIDEINENRNNLSEKVVNGMLWKFGERFCAQIITFIVSILLARLIAPEEYGSISVVIIFITIADVFLSSGFVMALIRKFRVTEVDLCSAFYANLFIALVIYAIIFVSAPALADAFNADDLTWLLRIMALKLPISAINTIQNAIVSRTMRFKMFFFATIIGTLISAVVGLYMAYNDYKCWAIVAQQLTNLTIDTLILMMFVRWFPKLKFSWESIKEMLPFSAKNMGTDLTGSIFNQLNAVVIGIKYSTEDLAYYTKGQQLPNVMSSTVTQALTSVMYPAIAKVFDDTEKVKMAYRKSLRILSFVLFPMLVGLAAVSKEVVDILYTSKWDGMIVYMQIMCIAAIIDVFGALDIVILKALGKAQTTLILEFIKKPIFLLLIFISMYFGVLAIAWCGVLITVLALLVNTTALAKNIHYGLHQKLFDCLFPLISSLLMLVAVLLVGLLPVDNVYIMGCLKVGVGGLVYLLCCLITKNREFFYLTNMILSKVFKKNNENTIKEV